MDHEDSLWLASLTTRAPSGADLKKRFNVVYEPPKFKGRLVVHKNTFEPTEANLRLLWAISDLTTFKSVGADCDTTLYLSSYVKGFFSYMISIFHVSYKTEKQLTSLLGIIPNKEIFNDSPTIQNNVHYRE